MRGRRSSGEGWALLGLGIGALAFLASTSSPARAEPNPPPQPLSPREVELLRFAARALDTVASVLGCARPPLQYVLGGDRNAWSDGTSLGVNVAWLDRELRGACIDQVCETAEVHCIMAHEMAHHLLHHLSPFAYVGHCPTNHRVELEADWIAGWVMGRLGITFAEPFRVLGKTASQSCTHPPGADRLEAFLDGHAAARIGLPWRRSRA